MQHPTRLRLFAYMYIFKIITQDEEAVDLSEDGDTPIVLGTSTKQPTKTGRKPTKRQRTEAVENDLLLKAIDCMDKTSQPMQDHGDGFDKFGQYIASELRDISNPQAQRWAKLQIQTVIFNAQSETGFHRPRFHSSVPHMETLYPPESFSMPHHFMTSENRSDSSSSSLHERLNSDEY